MSLRLALALTSAIFFSMVATVFSMLILQDSSPVLFPAIVLTACIISMAGAVILLSDPRTVPVRRYLIVPILPDLSMIFIFGLAGFFGSVTSVVFGIGILLLAPCSLAVFISLPKGGAIRPASVVLTSAICILAAVFLIIAMQDNLHGAIDPNLAWGVISLYWMTGMPVIGICYLANAVFIKKREDDSG